MAASVEVRVGAKVLFVVKEIEGAEPLGALYVAGCLERAGHVCRFVGTRGNDVLAEVRRFGPHIVAVGATTGLHRYYLGLLARVKEERPRCVTLMGGPHPTHYPSVIGARGLDVICRGEGEAAAVELADAVAEGGDPRHIADLWVKDEGRVFENGPRPLDRDLDGIPFPPRRLLYDYDATLGQRPLKSFTANRGCSYPCTYCFNQSLADHYGSGWRKVRVRSPENLVEEIAHVRSQGPLSIVAFRESVFAWTSAWLRQFGEIYEREIGLPYYCHVRADHMTDEMVDLLARSGCHSVNLGIETASARIANEVLGRRVDQARLRDGVKRLKRAGIVVFADNMVGLPGGTLEDDFATLRLNIELDVDYAAATLCTPYPGTRLAEYAREHGYFDGDFEAIEESYYTRSALRFRTPSEKQQIENFHKLFALTAALPSLAPLVRRLVRLPSNDFFYAAFRAWYVVSHVTEVMPRRPSAAQIAEMLASVFGLFPGSDPNCHPVPETGALRPAAAPARPGQEACHVA